MAATVSIIWSGSVIGSSHTCATLPCRSMTIVEGMEPVGNPRMESWVRIAGSTRPELDAPIIMNYGAGVVLHDLAIPDPAFDPTDQLTALVTSVIRPRSLVDEGRSG